MEDIMHHRTFINLPVKDLSRSLKFFTDLGFALDNRYRDDNGGCVVLNEGSFVMLLVYDFFRSFTKRPIPDTVGMSGQIIAMQLDSREAVDVLGRRADLAGATHGDTVEETSWMYVRRLADLDGPIWEFFYMDEKAALEQADAHKN